MGSKDPTTQLHLSILGWGGYKLSSYGDQSQELAIKTPLAQLIKVPYGLNPHMQLKFMTSLRASPQTLELDYSQSMVELKFKAIE